MRWAVLLACLLLPAAAAAQPATQQVQPPDRAWVGSLETLFYFFDDDDPLPMAVGSADRRALHLEARVQYEDRKTVSLWAGWNFEVGTTVQLTVVPMIGAIVGRTDGVAPGLEVTLAWRTLELYSEGEYVFSTAPDREGDFGYNWSEMRWQARDWLALGLSAQRTREHRSERTIDRGALVAASWGRAEFAFRWFNYEEGSRFAIVSVALEM